MRKRYAIPALVSLAALAGLLAYLARPDLPEPGVTWANAARIEIGTTEAEVVAIVGVSPSHAKLRYTGPDMIHENESPESAWILFWSDTECDILVYIDRNRRVVDVRVNGPPAPTWFDRARRRLGL